MRDYQSIAAHCKAQRDLSRQVIDEWLIYYAAGKSNLEKQFKKRIQPYSHAAGELKKSDLNMQISQYIAHSVFKEGGLIKKYLNHSQVRLRTPEELAFLEFQAANPWKFCFSVIVDTPAPDFYTMEDVFTGEQFLLYSPGTGTTIRGRGDMALWFNLIAFNGRCWETFGAIVGYSSFDSDDIFFFATELNPLISSDRELLEDLSQNPVPYMMLITGAAYPRTYHKAEEIVHAIGEFDARNLDLERIKKEFKVEYAQGIYRLTQKKWGEFPYFNTAYYSEEREEIVVSSMTDIGYSKLVAALARTGCDLPKYPNLRTHLTMLTTAESILKRKISLSPYEKYFPETPTQEEGENIQKLNELLSILIPAMNEGETPDLAAAAKKAGVGLDEAQDLMRIIQQKFDEMGR